MRRASGKDGRLARIRRRLGLAPAAAPLDTRRLAPVIWEPLRIGAGTMIWCPPTALPWDG